MLLRFRKITDWKAIESGKIVIYNGDVITITAIIIQAFKDRGKFLVVQVEKWEP